MVCVRFAFGFIAVWDINVTAMTTSRLSRMFRYSTRMLPIYLLIQETRNMFHLCALTLVMRRIYLFR